MMTALRRRRERRRHDDQLPRADRTSTWLDTADRLLADALRGAAEELRLFAQGAVQPAGRLVDGDDAWTWHLDVPDGIRRRNLDVTVDGDRVTVAAERRPGRLRRRRRRQRWEVTVRLPIRIDEQGVRAGMRGRELEVVIPKPPRLRRVRIPVRAVA